MEAVLWNGCIGLVVVVSGKIVSCGYTCCAAVGQQGEPRKDAILVAALSLPSPIIQLRSLQVG